MLNSRTHVDPAGQVARREGSQDVAHCFQLAVEIWPEVTKTPDVPLSSLIELGGQFLSLTSVANGVDRKPFFEEIYAGLDKAFPNNSAVLAFKGRFLTGYAWDARGGGYANTVTPERFKLFGERLDMAAEVLEPAWKMNPNDPAAATEMLTVELGQGRDREVMETWFKRAMKANPDNIAACRAKMLYLEPKWHGSPEEMIAFAHECRDGQNWYAQLPFQLVEAHQTLSQYAKDPDAYFHQPEVWEDLDSIYKPWLAAWPDNPFARVLRLPVRPMGNRQATVRTARRQSDPRAVRRRRQVGAISQGRHGRGAVAAEGNGSLLTFAVALRRRCPKRVRRHAVR